MNLNNLYLVLYIKVKIMYDQRVENKVLNDEFLLNDHYRIHHHIVIVMLQNEIYGLVYCRNVILKNENNLEEVLWINLRPSDPSDIFLMKSLAT